MDLTVDPTMSKTDIAQRRHDLGLAQPVSVRYPKWFGELMQGNLGYPFTNSQPVSTRIGELIGPRTSTSRRSRPQANLQEIGVKVKVEKVDFPTRQARSKAGDFQISLVGFSATFDPDFSSQIATGSAFSDASTPTSRWTTCWPRAS